MKSLSLELKNFGKEDNEGPFSFSCRDLFGKSLLIGRAVWEAAVVFKREVTVFARVEIRV